MDRWGRADEKWGNGDERWERTEDNGWNRGVSRGYNNGFEGERKFEVNEHILVGYKVIEKGFENGVVGLETTDGQQVRTIAIATQILQRGTGSIRSIYNAIIHYEDGEVKNFFHGAELDLRVKNFLMGGNLGFCCGKISGRGLYKF